MYYSSRKPFDLYNILAVHDDKQNKKLQMSHFSKQQVFEKKHNHSASLWC